MNADLLLIFVFIIVVVSIVGGVVSGIVQRVIDYKKAEKRLEGGSDSAQVARLTQKTEQLEERVRVLERIATDKDNSLAAEIEALRQLPDPLLDQDKERAAS